MEISVIVCCYNSSNRIKQTLEALHFQKTRIDWEIIIVDNKSTDNTTQISRAIWTEFNSQMPFKIISEPQPGLSFARKKGVLASKGKIIVFCDDDNHLDENYIQNVFEIMTEDSNIGALCGKNIPLFEIEPSKMITENLHAYACGEIEKESSYLEGQKSPWGAGLAMSSLFLKKLYSLNFISQLSDRKGTELSSGGDTEMCYLVKSIGRTWKYDTRLQLTHAIPKERMNAAYLAKIYYGFGKANAVIDWYYTHNQNDSKINFPKWYKVFLTTLKQKFLPSRLNKNEFDKNYQKGYLNQLFFDRKTFTKKRKYIKDILESLNAN
jgi:glycosyltransferase involved in cell wall biosynthesis